MDNIILIGMPGVGKSTLGVLLAKTLGMTFLDTDLVIQEQAGALLRDPIAARGIEGVKRLGSLKRRGVVLRPGQTLRMLYEERVPLYEQYAHLTIDCSGQDVEHTLDRVIRALEKRGQG